MSRQASEFQFKAMSLCYRGKEIFKPLNTGQIDERVACVREYIANMIHILFVCHGMLPTKM